MITHAKDVNAVPFSYFIWICKVSTDFGNEGLFAKQFDSTITATGNLLKIQSN